MRQLLLYVLLMLTLGSLNAATIVEALPNRQNVAVGDTVRVAVQVRDAPASTSWACLLRFDPRILRFEGQTAGNFATFVADSRSSADINSSGEIRTGGFSFTATGAGQNARLAEFSFRVIGSAATTQLDLIEKSVTEPFGCVFNNSGTDPVVPQLQDANLQNSSAPPISRRIRLQIQRGGADLPFGISIDPEDATATEAGGFMVFDGLLFGQDYLLTIAPAVTSNS